MEHHALFSSEDESKTRPIVSSAAISLGAFRVDAFSEWLIHSRLLGRI